MRYTNLHVRALLVAVLAVAAVPPAQAQEVLTVSVAEENFRAEPSGTRIAILLEGAALSAGESRPQWREVTLEGWVPETGVVSTSRDGYELAIRRTGTTLHASRAGAVVARGMEGFLLHEVERADGWIRVTRTGWIWDASVEAAPAGATERTAPPRAAERGTAGTSAPNPAQAAPSNAAAVPGGTSRTIHRTPSGASLGTLAAETPYEVVGEEGEWTRVRIEGWIHTPGESETGPDPSAPLRGLSLRTLRDDPAAYRGRAVAWRVQFVAVQRADSLRTDLVPGESYILARDPGGEPGYVYIAVPPELLPAVRRLIPLQQVEVVGRVRTGRSELMGHPVLDLIDLRSARS